MIFAGIDIGSRTSKAVILNGEGIKGYSHRQQVIVVRHLAEEVKLIEHGIDGTAEEVKILKETQNGQIHSDRNRQQKFASFLSS